MGYRTSAREAESAEPEKTGDALTRVEVSGRAGLPGAPGRSGADGAGWGAHGQPGGNAGPAEVGQDAGIIHAILSSDPSDSENVILGGNHTTADGHRKGLSRTVAMGDAGFVDLVARGGHGGHGGHGGRGGDGARGSPGSDATRYSRGTDGGRGGHGGTGGIGSNGADGGSGGAIIAEVAHEDTHLLMLLRYGVEGGPGGAAGTNGHGGSGGRGGSGGSSYSWTETESYTDSNGQSQTRTRYHSNPGGSDGLPGGAGLPGTAHLVMGQSGGPGSFVIHVTSKGETHSYPERYDLRLLGFEHQSDNHDGIYEPEEMIHITKIEVMNVGGMPTPATREIQLSLREQGWIYPEKQHLTLPFSLGAGQRHTFSTEKLTAKLGAFHPSKPSDPLAQEEVVRHRAYVPDVRREFAHYESHRSFELGRFLIRFPIEASSIESLYSLGPGQTARLRFSIRNPSTKAYGARTELGRRVTFRMFFHESELGDEHVHFFDDTGARVPLSRGFSREIPELLPGQTITFEGILAVAENAPFYRAGRMWLALELGSIEEPSKTKPIQYRAFDVRVARPFDKHALGDVLLVVNNRTEAAEVEAWQGLFSALGLRSSVYDVSLEGSFELRPENGLGKDDLRSRTIVFLNQFMDTVKGERKSIHYVSKEQLLEACAAGAHVHIVGEPFHLERFLTPTFEEASSQALVLAQSNYLAPTKDKPRERLSVGDGPHMLEISKWSVLGFGRPSEKALVARAKSIQDRLERLYPDRRHVLVWEMAPKLVKDYFVASRYRLGRIAIHRSLDVNRAAISTTMRKEAPEKRGEYVLQRENILQFVLALPFSEKLQRLEALTASMAERDDDDDTLKGSVVSIVLHAIVIDLVTEQLEILRRRWCQGATPRSLRASVDHLRAVTDKLYDAQKGALPAAARAALLHILSSMHFFASSQVEFWEWIPPFLFERRATVLRGVTIDLINTCIVRLCGGSDPKSADAREEIATFKAEIDVARKAFVARYRHSKKHHEWTGNLASYARDLFLRPLEDKDFKRSTDVLRDMESSIVSKGDHAGVRAKDVQAAEKRRILMKRAATAKDALLLDARCAELLANAKKD